MASVFIDFGTEDDIDLEIDEIEEETCLATLGQWYQKSEELADWIKDQVSFATEVGKADDAWVWRAGQKIAYLRKGVRRIEQRMLRLGGMPPYRLNDGRAKYIKNCERMIAAAKQYFNQNDLPFPWKAES